MKRKIFKILGFLLILGSGLVIIGMVVGFPHQLWFAVDILIIVVGMISGWLLLLKKN